MLLKAGTIVMFLLIGPIVNREERAIGIEGVLGHFYEINSLAVLFPKAV